MRQDILIERKVNIYSARSYIAEVFHGQRMFNTITNVSCEMAQNCRSEIALMSLQFVLKARAEENQAEKWVTKWVSRHLIATC